MLWPVVALGVLVVGYVAWEAVGGGRSAHAGFVSDLITLPFGLVASMLVLRMALRGTTDKRARTAWLFLGLSFLAFWLGDVLWFVGELSPLGAASPSWADLGYLANYPLLLVGLILLGKPSGSRPEKLKAVLDIGIIFIGGALLVWYFFLWPVIQTAGWSLGDAITVAYPLGDLLLLAGIAALAVRHHRLIGWGPLVVLLGGLGLQLVTDMIYGRLTVAGVYQSGGFVDLGYLVFWSLMALAAQMAFAACMRGSGAVAAAAKHRGDWTSFLPYLSLPVGLGVLVYALRNEFGAAASAAALGAVLVMALAMARQVVAIRESSRLREQEAVRLGEERFQKALLRTQFSVDRAGDSILWLDGWAKVVDVNESACRILEYSRDELLTMTMFEVDPHLTPVRWTSHWRMLKERGTLTFEARQRSKTGRIFPAEITTNYLDFEGEEYSCSVFRDVSDRKRAEQTLRESEERLVRAQAVAHVGSWELELATGTMWGSAEALRIYGFEPFLTSLPLEQIQKIAMDEDRPRLDAALRSLIQARVPYDLDFRITRPNDGETRVVHSVADLVGDERGAPLKVLGTIEDVTEQRRTQETLLLTQFSVDQASDAVFWLSTEGLVLYANDSACDLLGYSRGELLNMPIFDFCLDLPRSAWQDRWGEVRAGQPAIVQRHFCAKDGESIPVEISASLFVYEGREYNCAFVRDIRERRRVEQVLGETEAQLRQSQKMEAIGQLAGGIAHDFNNLLTAINGYSDLILGSDEPLTGMHRADVLEIKAAGGRAAALTRQILAFSRSQTLQPEVLSLNDLVSNAERLLGRTLGEQIDLLAILPPNLGFTEVDADQISNVLMNLALNARDAMPQGGKLTIETANVEVDQKFCREHGEITPGSYVRLAVSDTGTGMDEETRSRAFDPFFTTKAPGRGTGLGLATVYGTVRQSGGSIFVRSEAGVGTTFEIYLPKVAKESTNRSSQKDDSVAQGGEETVLVVEDEAGVRELVNRVLTGLGYAVVEAGDGDEAVEYLQHNPDPIDLLLTDVVLPGSLQGNELAQVMGRMRPGVPVLFMSGHPRESLGQAGRLAAGVRLLEKPFSPDKLARQVRKTLDFATAGAGQARSG